MVMVRFGAGSGRKEVESGMLEKLFSLTVLMKVVLHLFILSGFFFILTLRPNRQPQLDVLPPVGLWGSLAFSWGPWYTSGLDCISLQSFPACVC